MKLGQWKDAIKKKLKGGEQDEVDSGSDSDSDSDKEKGKDKEKEKDKGACGD